MNAQPLRFPTRCITTGCDGFAGDRMFCLRCSEGIEAAGAFRAKAVRRETSRRMFWWRARRWLARAEFAAFLAVSLVGMGLAFYGVWLLVGAWR